VALAAALAGALLYLTRGTAATTAQAPQPAPPTFPAPPAGAVVFADAHGRDAVALAVSPGFALQASVVGPQGNGVTGLPLRFRVSRRDGSSTTTTAQPCGAGCYRAAAGGAPARVDVVLPDGVVAFAMPSRWPARDASALVARAAGKWRRLHTLVFHETLSSGLGHVVRSTWTVAAPDRLTYRIAGGSSAVVIGSKRWDRDPGKAWRESPQQPLHQPTPPWAAVADAHVVGTQRLDGRTASVVTFYDAKTRGWFRLAVDTATMHVLETRMIATSHFMRDVYGPFDRPLKIVPPV
jgi:hypothetical protein